MTRRVLEKIFRHGAAFLSLLILPTLIALVVVYFQPRQYQGAATLWALERYSVIGATGIEADLNATPASTQATALQELLQTHSFDLNVAKETGLASTFDASTRANPAKLEAAIEQELSTKVIVLAVGANLYQITYDNTHASVAGQVVKAVVDQFGAEATGFSISEAQQLIGANQQQLVQAEGASTTATKAAATYIESHPNATIANDPNYSLLQQQAQNAAANVTYLQNNITQLKQQIVTVGNGSGGLYQVIDLPAVGSQPVSRTKTLLLGGGIGLAVGLLAITLLLIALLRRDRSAYSPDDLRRIVDVPVALELPELPSKVVVAVIRGQRALPERSASRH